MILDKCCKYKGGDSNEHRHYYKADMEHIMRQTTKSEIHRLRCLMTLSLLHTDAMNSMKIFNKKLRRMSKQEAVAYLNVLS